MAIWGNIGGSIIGTLVGELAEHWWLNGGNIGSLLDIGG